MKTSELGKLVRMQRKSLKMSQGDLALVSGTGLRFIGELERGKETCEIGKTLQVLVNLGIGIAVKTKQGGKDA